MSRDNRHIEPVFIEVVDVENRLREPSEESVSKLARSIEQIGLRTPITVRTVNDGERLVLVTGATRLAACKSLGWEKIDAFIEDEDDFDEIDAQLWEIAENLHRAELTKLERDEQVALWVKLQDQKREAVSAQSAQKPQGGRPEGGVSAASRDLGLDRDDARRAVQTAALSDRAKETARELGFDDNRSVLLQAARQHSPSDEVAFLRREHERREAERARKEAEKANRDTDRVISLTDAEQFAAWLTDHIAPGEVNTLISWLEGTKPRDVIAALRREAA